MQGVFAPPSPTGTKRDLDEVSRAAPLGAPLVEWGEVTAVPDTEHGTGHVELPTFLVYSPLPNFKLGGYHFFIVPKGTSGTTTVVESKQIHWLSPYTDYDSCGETWGVPFSILHQEKITKMRSEENKRIKQNYETKQNTYQMAKAKETATKKHFEKQLGKTVKDYDSTITTDTFQVHYFDALLDLPVSPTHDMIAMYIFNNFFHGDRRINLDYVKNTVQKIDACNAAQKEVEDTQKEYAAARVDWDALTNTQKKKKQYVWKKGKPAAELSPYTVEVLTAGRLENLLLRDAYDHNKNQDLAHEAVQIVQETLGKNKAIAVGALIASLYRSKHDFLTNEFITMVKFNFATAFQRFMTLEGYGNDRVNSMYNVINNWDSTITQRMDLVNELYRYVAENFWCDSSTTGPMKVLYDTIYSAILGSMNGKNIDNEVAVPFRDYLPANTPNVYEIDEEWLRERVENAERWDYEFAVRMQGLSNSSLASVWAPPANNPVFDNGHGVMQRFAETLINHFYDFFVVQEKKDYSPESVIREVVHMHKIFADEWVRQNKNTLSPQLEAMGEAYVSLFFTGPLAALKNTDAALIARLLRRHEKFRGHFGLCLQHYMTKMECDRIGRSPTYKQTNIIANQNMLAVQSMATFLQANLTQIQNELKNEQNATIPEDILKMFHKYTLDWFRIADQLPPPKSRFPGYTHPEGSDQDPNRQSKWQKVLDHSSRGGKVG